MSIGFLEANLEKSCSKTELLHWRYLQISSEKIAAHLFRHKCFRRQFILVKYRYAVTHETIPTNNSIVDGGSIYNIGAKQSSDHYLKRMENFIYATRKLGLTWNNN